MFFVKNNYNRYRLTILLKPRQLPFCRFYYTMTTHPLNRKYVIFQHKRRQKTQRFHQSQRLQEFGGGDFVRHSHDQRRNDAH